jgi:hypothetical protein
MTPIEELLSRSRSPLGPPAVIDFGPGLLGELAGLLAHVNGFATFNYGLQVFRSGPVGLGPELEVWNAPDTWRHTYGTLTDGLFFFAQDLFGVQFAIEDGSRVCRFDPETGGRETIGAVLDDWAAWLLADPEVRAARSFAAHWQETHGPLGHDERLLPRTFFVLGGAYEQDNLVVSDAAAAMRVRGPIAQQIHRLPDGSEIEIDVNG